VPVIVLIGLDNWMFLMFPTRMGAGDAGDLSQAVATC